MIMIWSFLVFDYIYLLTNGGPAQSSEVLATLTYSTAFYSMRVGYATAIALSMTFFSAVFVSMFVILRRLGWEIEMFRRKRTASLIPNYLILILLALFSLVPVILLFF